MRLAGLATALCMIGGVAQAAPFDVVGATYTEPTDRYTHGILGDAIEWGALLLAVNACPDCPDMDLREFTIRLPETRVFEDTAPRLVDIDNDGLNEVMVVETSLTQGARLAIYDENGVKAAIPFIGQTNRWLAPVGVGDMDGDGTIELVYVDRPHLFKILTVWRWKNGALEKVADRAELTNHRIGETDIGGGMRDCGGVVEAITANADFTRVMATRLDTGRLFSRDVGPYEGRQSFADALSC